MNTDVLVVGAGPTGLMLANQLVRRGIRTQIVDRHEGPARQTRAMAVHARTLEIYAKLGIADRALALGRIGDGANMWSGGLHRARIPFGDIGASLSPFPFVLMLGQDDNEHLLNEQLVEQGLHVDWRTELTALTQRPAAVEAIVVDVAGRSRTITARFVVGCDGHRSAVRQLNGIGFPGAQYEHVFFVADTEATGPMRSNELNVYLWRSGFHLFFPMMRGSNRWRVIGILPQRLADRSDLAFSVLTDSIKAEVGQTLQFTSCDWFSTYRIHHRRTERFRVGRCFLAGDAAHVHSPMGGQGMNTGLQDAYNLAWKLALVIEGRARDSLLDSYEIERMRVADRLLASTDRAFGMLVSDHPIARFLRTRIVARAAAAAMRYAPARRAAFRTVSMIGVGYPKSPLSLALARPPRGAPRPGERFPWAKFLFEGSREPEDLFARLDDTRFNLLVVGQPVPTGVGRAWNERLQIHVVTATAANRRELDRLHIAAPSVYLLRPDGHVGLTGDVLTAGVLESWFARAGISAAGMSPIEGPKTVRAA